MKTAETLVKAFHTLHSLDRRRFDGSYQLTALAVLDLDLIASDLRDRVKTALTREHIATQRVAFLLEETAELCEALCKNDPVAVLDAICDLLYVTIGMGVQLDMPVSEGFLAVHESNMTKTPNGDPRVLDKGPNYVPPTAALASALKQRWT